MSNTQRLISGIVAALVLAAFANVASAIPAFARKYKTSCATCHEAFPRLSAVGETFRLNGYKFADDEMYIKDEPVEMGDEAYKKIWPKAIWPADIPGLPPLAVVLKSQFQWDIGGTKSARSQFLFPEMAKILGAGAIGESMSFFFELGFDRSGGGHGGGHGEASEGTVTSVEGWLMIEDLIGPTNAVNVRVGTVGMHEIGLFMARNHNRLTSTPYLYASGLPAPSHHFAEEMGLDEDTAEFEANPFSLHAQPGVEVNGFGSRWRYAVGVVNGNGDKFEDNNSEKDLYMQTAWKIGGLGFDGSGGKDDDGQLSSSDPWRDNSITLAAFGYWGTSQVVITGVDESGDGVSFNQQDKFWRGGVGIQGKYNDLAVRCGYIYGHHGNPYGALTPKQVASHSWFAEAEYFVLPWLIPNIRYEAVRYILPTAVEGISNQDLRRVVVGVKALIRANVSVTVEGRFNTRAEGSRERNDDDQAMVSMEVAF